MNKSRQLISMILCVFTFVALLSGTSLISYAATTSGGVVATISSTSGKVGDEVTINVSLPANSNMAGGSFNLVYDSSKLSVVSATAGSLITSSFNSVNTTYATNKIRVTWAGSTAITSSGNLLTVKFKLNSTGTASLSLENFKLADADAVAMECSAGTGTITISSEPTTTYTISYNANGGSGAPTSQTKTKDVTLTLSSTEPTRTGYVFNGWKCSYCGSIHNASSSYTHNASSTLTAQWTANIPISGTCGENLTWVLDSDGILTISGTGTMKNSVTTSDIPWYDYRSNIQKVIIEEGVSTIGYMAFNSCENLISVQIPSSVTSIMRMAFSKCSSLVNVEIPNGVISIGTYAFEECINLESISIPGSVTTIDNWAFENCSSLSDVYYFGTEAQWSKITIGQTSNEYLLNATMHYVNNCSILYDYSKNGGTSSTKTSATVVVGSNADLTPVATKSGWSFVGWNTDPNATVGLSSYVVTDDVTLYAIYKKTLTASFCYGNNSIQTTKTVTIYNNATSGSITTPTLSTYSGWNAVGWRDDTTASPKEYSSSESVSISSDIKFYGIYSRTLTLSYNANAGSGAPSNQTATQYYNAYGNMQNVNLTISSTKPTRTGYTFLGWSTSSSATSATYYAGGSYTSNSSATLYAVWKQNSAPTTDAKIKISSTRGTADKEVTVTVSLENNPGIISMLLNLNYDKNNLTLTNVDDSGILGTTVHGNNLSSVPYVLCWANDTASSNYVVNGTIVTLTFKIKDTAPEGTYPITITYDNSNDEILNLDFEPVDFEVINGEIEVCDYVPGDVTGDGKVTATDRITLARYLSKWDGYDASSLDLNAADVNGDGKVTATDRIIIARYLSKWDGYDELPHIDN